jgi:RNA polymerase sigma-70 factor (ECF subfamily)
VDTDSDLVTRALAGEEAAFEALMGRYLGTVFNFALRFVGDREAAEDVAQETFFKVWKNLARYRVTDSFKTWVFAIARNTALDALRKRRDVHMSDFDTADGKNMIEETLADQAPLPDELVERARGAAALERLIAQLSPAYREVVLLHAKEGLTFEEVGHVVGRPLNTVKSQYRRGLAEIRKLLGDAPNGGFIA